MSASNDRDDSAGSPLLSPSLSSSHEVDAPREGPLSGLKRAAMATADEEPAKRQATSTADSGKEIVYRVLCPTNRVGSVIGKGGAVIEQLRKESGAKINVTESRGHVDFRVIIISSPASADEDWSPAQEALFRIHRWVATSRTCLDTRETEVVLVVFHQSHVKWLDCMVR
jgi:predicted PilT family ATPase